MWKRKCNELAFTWGTIGMTSLDEPRPNFRGQMGIDAVTGRTMPQYPRWKTNVKVRFLIRQDDAIYGDEFLILEG